MEDLQLNISVSKKVCNIFYYCYSLYVHDINFHVIFLKNNKKIGAPKKDVSEYKFLAKPNFTGKTIARKRPQTLSQKGITLQDNEGEPLKKVSKQVPSPQAKKLDLATNLRDLSENKGKFHGKNYQDLSDDIKIKQKPRSGGWITSLFKNNPDVPRIGQRAIKPIVEKVFSGTTFADLDIHPHCVANLQQNLNIKDLMTVQQNAIPVILQGRDVLIR